MNKYDQIQKKLVEKCEKVHEAGMRHSGLSGTIVENLLIKELNGNIKKFNFDRGVIKFCKKKGRNLREKTLHKQYDVIIYKGESANKFGDNVVVNIDHVKGVVEVKKWACSGNLKMGNSVYKRIKESSKLLKKESKRKIPVFFVAFRFHDKKKGKEGWSDSIKKFSTQNVYCFFGEYSKSGGYKYPWEEGERWDKFSQKSGYGGEFQKLVKKIKNLR